MAVLVGKQAPDFNATAVFGNNEMKPLKLSDLKGKYVAIFFYPLDFTFVCPSELIAFERRMPEFARRNVDVVGCSIDSAYTHLAWKKTSYAEGGVGPLSYPLISDMTHAVSRSSRAVAGDMP